MKDGSAVNPGEYLSERVLHQELRNFAGGAEVGRLNASLKALRSGLARLGAHLRRGAAAAYAVLLISLLLTLLAFHYVQQNVEAQTRVRFEETTRATQEAIERKTKAYLDAMFGARGLFYASESVTRQEWGNYVEGIEPAASRVSRP